MSGIRGSFVVLQKVLQLCSGSLLGTYTVSQNQKSSKDCGAAQICAARGGRPPRAFNPDEPDV